MSLKMMYDEVADGYATESNRFGSISKSHECAIQQISKIYLDKNSSLKMLDLGVGDGAFLQKLHLLFPNTSFTGMDISAGMLKLAKTSLPQMTTIEASASVANQVLPHASQSLVLAHFINAYIPIDTLLSQVHSLLESEGYFSFITTTYDAFPNGHKKLKEYIAKNSLFSKILRYFYRNGVKNTTVAKNQKELIQKLKKHQFEIVDHQRLNISLSFNNIDELRSFAVEGGWFLNALDKTFIPQKFAIKMARPIINHNLAFPYEDIHCIDVVLARKCPS